MLEQRAGRMVMPNRDAFDVLAEQLDRITSQLESEPGRRPEATRTELHDALGAMAAELRERREAEATLRRSEAQFRTLVERIPDVVLVLDPEGRILYANPSLATTLGHRPEDAQGRGIVDLVHPEDVLALRASLDAGRAGPEPGPGCTARMRHRNGAWRLAEILTSRLGDRGEGLLLVARDATVRGMAEGAVRVSERRYALAVDGGGDGLWDWDLASDRIHFSSRWKELVGAEEAEVGDHPSEWFRRIHAEDLPRVKADLAAHLEGRVPRLDTEHRILLPDGRHRWVVARGLAVRDGAGKASRLAGFLSDVTDRKAAEDLLVHQAVHDALTGLPNRAALMDRLERSIARARHKTDYLFAVLFLDIDRFKLVNDSLGHVSGDQLLVAFARRLSGCLRPGDMVSHVGGDEFAVLADHINRPEDATQIATRVQRAFAAPFDLAGQELFATASIGIALSSTGYERPEDALRDADSAMYRAKSKGSGRYELFDREMHARALTRLQLETDLRRAVERREFRLHYQPIVRLDTGAMSGFEALIRWQHPERGLVAPMEFIPVAEETGLIVPIGAWVVREACRQARRWQETFPGRRLSISMNVTSTHFTEADVMRGVEDALQETGLEGRDLMLEITESVMMKNIDSVIAVLLALKSMDIELHIDDFGTGYSSLSYLHSLPTDALKIDRSFVSRMDAEGGDATIVRTIIEMAHNLGRHVIAEGIETADQLARLRALGCEYGQGYFFSRPLDPDATEALIRSDPRW